MQINLNQLICPGRKFLRFCAIMFLTGTLLSQAVVTWASPNSDALNSPPPAANDYCKRYR